MSRSDYIASDVHLGAVPEETERAFVDFLSHVGARGRSLLLAGDLFDFWFEYGTVVPGEHYRVLAALAELVDAGVPVTMVGGNHDAWGGRFLREEVGLRFSPDPLRIDLAGRAALVAHGDGVGEGDLRYRLLKRVLRSRAATAGFRLLPAGLGTRLARAVSSTDIKAEQDAAAKGRARHIAGWATEQLRARPELGWVVCGHAHLPAVREVEPDRWYLNAGDWIRHKSYITVSAEGEPRLHSWPEDAPGQGGDQAASL